VAGLIQVPCLLGFRVLVLRYQYRCQLTEWVTASGADEGCSTVRGVGEPGVGGGSLNARINQTLALTPQTVNPELMQI
jgi:hypothetical protein